MEDFDPRDIYRNWYKNIKNIDYNQMAQDYFAMINVEGAEFPILQPKEIALYGFWAGVLAFEGLSDVIYSSHYQYIQRHFMLAVAQELERFKKRVQLLSYENPTNDFMLNDILATEVNEDVASKLVRTLFYSGVEILDPGALEIKENLLSCVPNDAVHAHKLKEQDLIKKINWENVYLSANAVTQYAFFNAKKVERI